jgi:hypothetical protein
LPPAWDSPIATTATSATAAIQGSRRRICDQGGRFPVHRPASLLQ